MSPAKLPEMLHSKRLFTSSGYIEGGMIEGGMIEGGIIDNGAVEEGKAEEIRVENDARTAPYGRALDFSRLPPFLRTLLTTDGTVTKSLESFFWEPVKVENVGQLRVTLTSDKAVINRQAGQQVLRRSIQLRGAHTNKTYAKATSLICIEMLEPEIAGALEEGKVGIGELLRECGLETYREVLGVGALPGDETDAVEARQIWRTYRIVMGHQPVIQVTETFPLAVYL